MRVQELTKCSLQLRMCANVHCLGTWNVGRRFSISTAGVAGFWYYFVLRKNNCRWQWLTEKKPLFSRSRSRIVLYTYIRSLPD